MIIGPKRICDLTPDEAAALKYRMVNVESVEGDVYRILEDVRRGGDKAVLRYTELLDGVRLTSSDIVVGRDEIEESYANTPDRTLRLLEAAADSIRRFHECQMPPARTSLSLIGGVTVTITVKPISRVGVYVPGGLHPYPSTALMAIIPAKVAGVDQVIACTPPGRDGRVNDLTLVALDIAGADKIYKVGGAQAIAAMAYGTETIPRVDKVVGPGNIYVTAAKKLVSGTVGVDMLAGPSEIVVLAEEPAEPMWLAYDLTAQLEHGIGSSAILVALSKDLAVRVYEDMLKILSDHENRQIAILIASDVDEAIEFIDEYAPEHLEVVARDPPSIISRVRNAGSISVGLWTPVALGDYATGVNHILPTSGAARFRGALTVYDYIKLVPVQNVTPEGYRRIWKIAHFLAELEDMKFHAKSLLVRVTPEWKGAK